MFTTRSSFQKAWIERHYLDILRSSARGIFEDEPSFEFRVAPGEGARENDLHPDYTFETFFVSAANRIAHAACIAVSELPHEATDTARDVSRSGAATTADDDAGWTASADYNPLFVYGGHGTGKTHLLQATCHRFRRPGGEFDGDGAAAFGRHALFFPAEEFTNRFLIASDLAQGDIVDRLFPGRTARLGGAGALVLDDVHFFSGKEGLQERFYHVLNTLLGHDVQVVLGSSRSPARLDASVHRRLLSRFQCGLVARLDPPELATRIAVASRKARARGFDLRPDVAEYVAVTAGQNFWELDGALTQVLGAADLSHRSIPGRSGRTPASTNRSDSRPEITLELARSALHERTKDSRGAAEGVTMARILELVQDHFRVRPKDLLSRSKVRTLVRARQVGMHLARELTTLSLEEIGLHFGGRDHSTVFYALHRIRALENEKPDVRATIQSLRQRLVCEAQ